jgi:acyl dehydratase
MTSFTSQPRGLYFEEFQVGMHIISPGRTVTETDIVNFAGLSGDFNQIHTDAVFGAASAASQRVAHGLLVLSIASGLGMRTGTLEGTVMYFREITEWKFVKPVFIGDTVHVVMEVIETKSMPRIGGGAVTLKLDVKNQQDETTMRGSWTVLVYSRPGG